MTRARVAAHTAKMLLATVRNPPWTSPGHFYSPQTTAADVERALLQGPVTDLVDIRTFAQDELLAQLAPMWSEFVGGPRWHGRADNTQYGLADGAVYASMLRTFKPRRVIEIGSGYSSAIALDTRQRFGMNVQLTFIEPFTERLDALLTAEDRASAVIRREFVQDTPLSVLDALEPGDMLFIDSTHVLKAGSDVEHLLFRVLPRLPIGVLVHIHDCFWPWQYPEEWLRQRRDWNELYYVHAFLIGNRDWEVVLFDDWVWQERRPVVEKHLPAAAGQRPGGLWLRRVSSQPADLPGR